MRTQCWKGTTKGSFQQSLVEIGSVVSEEKILLKFHPPFFSIFSLVADGSLPKICQAVRPFDQDGPPQPNLA
jgi:UV DNA damage repair endonuclease